MEFNVKADLSIEPDGAYLLEGGVAHLQLFEKSGMKDEEGKFIKRGKMFLFFLKENITVIGKCQSSTMITCHFSIIYSCLIKMSAFFRTSNNW